MRPDDGGSSRPPLPAEAGPTERTLYDVYDAQTGIVELTASDWATSAESVRGLSADVRGIVNALRGAPDAWSGPAAEAAYQTLGKLAENLDGHAEEIDRIEAGLTSAHDSLTAARADYVTTVRSISLDVDQADYQRTLARQPAQPVPDGTVLDRQAYDQAVAGAKAAREKAAAAVLASFTDSMTTAARKLPVDPVDSTPVQGGSSGGGAGGGSATGGGTRPGGAPYLPPTSVGDPAWHPTTVTGGGDVPGGTDTGGTDTGGTDTGPAGGDPGGGSTVVDPAPPVLDGSVGGTTGPGSTGGVGPVPGSTGAGAPAGQVGGGGAAAGVGGMMAGGGAAAMFGRGGMPGGAASGGLAGRAGSATSAGRAGSAGSTGAAGSANRSSVLAGGGQGGAARSGAGGKGAGRTGRYGVPKLGERGGGRGVAGVAGGAGGRGAKGERDDAPDVDHLTLEDEETWFEGAEDATPPVWE